MIIIVRWKVPDTLFVVKMKVDGSGNHTHYIHIYQKGNPRLKNELIFRDYLHFDKVALQAYNDLIIELSKKHNTNPLAYTNGKTECIEKILNRARVLFQ